VLVFHKSVFLVCIAATLFQPLSVLAYDLNASVVTEDKGIFHIKISAIIEAPAEHIRQALSDYTHIYRLSNRIGLAPGKTVLDVENKLLKVVPDEFKHDAHHWLILHGRYICQARKPKCGTCIIHDLCEYKNKEEP